MRDRGGPRGLGSTPGGDMSRGRADGRAGVRTQAAPRRPPSPPLPMALTPTQARTGTRMGNCQLSEVTQSQGIRREYGHRAGPCPQTPLIPAQTLRWEEATRGAAVSRPVCVCEVGVERVTRAGIETPAPGPGQPWAPPHDTETAVGSDGGGRGRPAGVPMSSLATSPGYLGPLWGRGSSHCDRYLSTIMKTHATGRPWGPGTGQGSQPVTPLRSGDLTERGQRWQGDRLSGDVKPLRGSSRGTTGLCKDRKREHRCCLPLNLPPTVNSRPQVPLPTACNSRAKTISEKPHPNTGSH